MKFGAVLQACRERAGLSQEALAELLHRTQSCISRFEKDKKVLDTQTFLRWADVTNSREVVIAYLYGSDTLTILQQFFGGGII